MIALIVWWFVAVSQTGTTSMVGPFLKEKQCKEIQTIVARWSFASPCWISKK